jgi:hypothetical protein
MRDAASHGVSVFTPQADGDRRSSRAQRFAFVGGNDRYANSTLERPRLD